MGKIKKDVDLDTQNSFYLKHNCKIEFGITEIAKQVRQILIRVT